MPRQQTLKVFRTPIGFHDAYVAAPSQKAALEAWGSDTNLFASGAAERVEDPELMREPLDNPGKVIRRLRGTMAEHMAALPKDAPRRASKKKSQKPVKGAKPTPAPSTLKRRPPRKPKRRPSRASLDRTEAALADALERHNDARATLTRKQAELDRERRKMEKDQEREQARLARQVETARTRYERAMDIWRND